MPSDPREPATDDDPTDAEIEAAIRTARADARRRLRASLDELTATLGERPTSSWGGGERLADGSMTMHYAVYDPIVWRLVEALEPAGAEPVLDWMAWVDDRPELTLDAVAAMSLADVARSLAALVCAERFYDGTIAGALADGTFVALVRRVLDAVPA